MDTIGTTATIGIREMADISFACRVALDNMPSRSVHEKAERNIVIEVKRKMDKRIYLSRKLQEKRSIAA